MSVAAAATALLNLPSVLLGQLLLEFVQDPGSLARLVEVVLGADTAATAAARAACLAVLAETPLHASHAMGDPQVAWARARCASVKLRMYADMACVRMPGNIRARARLLNGRNMHSNDARAAAVLRSPLGGGTVISEWRREGALHRAAKDAVAGNDLPAIVVRYAWDGSPVRCEWWNDGQRHRGGGRPAVIHADGRFEWWVRGVLHRGGCKWPRPALIMPGGRREWFVGGRRHRTGGLPAVVHALEQQWWVDDELHRTDGGPALVNANGRRRAWYAHGVPHRPGGLPAVEDDDARSFLWYEHGQRHRAGGKPAVVRRAGIYVTVTVTVTVTVEWWVQGQRHRDKDRPAVLTVKCSNIAHLCRKCVTRQWWTNGQRQAAADYLEVEESERVRRCPTLVVPYHIRRH